MQLHSLLRTQPFFFPPARRIPFFFLRPTEYQRKEASAGREFGHLYLTFLKYVYVFLWVSLIWNLDSLSAWCWMSIFWWLTSIIKWKKCKETLKDWLTRNVFSWFNKRAGIHIFTKFLSLKNFTSTGKKIFFKIL